MSRGLAGRAAAVLALAVVLSGAEIASTSSNTYAEPAARHPTSDGLVVAFGDSVPSGYACGCRPFPEIYGSLLQAATSRPVRVENRAVNGLTTSGLLSQLQASDDRAAVRASGVVLVTIGANDFNDHHEQVEQDRCGRHGTECVRGELASMRANLAAALARIDALRRGSPASVLVTGYWNVFEDGEVALAAYGAAGVRSSLRLTRQVNAKIRSVAAGAGALRRHLPPVRDLRPRCDDAPGRRRQPSGRRRAPAHRPHAAPGRPARVTLPV